MKKKLLALTLLMTLSLSACGNQPATAENSAEPVVESSVESSVVSSVAEESSQLEESSDSSLSELDALGNIEVEKQLFDVTLTIPADYVGESTQEDLDKIRDEYGYESVTLNDDGSATYVMTKSQHKKMLDEYRTQINTSLQEMVDSEDYPNFTDIEANDNYTEFTITTKSTELDFSESFSVLAFYMYGGMYAIFSGEAVDNVSVTFVNADSGEVINTSNSADMAN